jgi:hypothetical protein
MTVNDLLQIVRGLFVLIAVLTAVDFIRQRDQVRLEVALLFVSKAHTVALLIEERSTRPDWLAVLGRIAVAAQPYLLLRLVQRLQPVPAWIQRVAIAGMVLSCGILLIPRPPALSGLLAISSVGPELRRTGIHPQGAHDARRPGWG